MTWPGILVVVAVWAVLAYLVLFDAAVARWRRERDELARVGGRVDTTPRVPPPPIRRDPSPLPRGRVLDRDRDDTEHRRYDSDEFDYSGCVVCDSNGDTHGWPCPTVLKADVRHTLDCRVAGCSRCLELREAVR